jgi:L-asparaginase
MAVTVIATGGTIASTRGDDGRVTATLTGAELLDALPPMDLEVRVVDLPVAGSWNLSSEQAQEVVAAARRAAEDGAQGVVITHGTDVLEETAWLAELMVRPLVATPVVLTASMRHASEFAGDGPRNLLDALRVASHPDAVARGALVCANGELHHARWVTKTHATSVATFGSPGRGPVGEVGEHDVRFLAPSPAAIAPLDRPLSGRVPILCSHWDADPELVEWYLDGRADGFVIEATGAGNVNRGLVDGLMSALDRGVPVVVTTRCARGEATPIYGGVGGFASLHAAGAVSAHGLGAGKARLALQLAIGNARGEQVRRLFEQLATPG